MKSLRLAILMTILLAAAVAAAGPRDHLDGFFLRLSVGGGSADTAYDDGTDDLEFSGTAGDVNIAIGGIVAPNLALHGTLFGASMTDPDFAINGATGVVNGDITMAGLGVGLTYYIMPANIYVSGSIGSGTMELDSFVDARTDRGPMLDVTVGKEWWVGEKWALGVAVGLQAHKFGESGMDESWSGTSKAIRFSATMN